MCRPAHDDRGNAAPAIERSRAHPRNRVGREGNKAETRTLLPVLRAFRDRHAVTDLVVVADAGMLSAANLDALEDAGFSFIVGARTSSAPHDLHPHFERHGNLFEDGQTIETTRMMGAVTGAAARERRVVWQYSRKREKRDNITLNKQIDRAERIADGSKPMRRDRFVTVDGTTVGVNWGQVEKARTWLGLKGYVTNIPQLALDGAEVVAAYHDLFQVEASFRMAKSDLRARPMFHHERVDEGAPVPPIAARRAGSWLATVEDWHGPFITQACMRS